MSALAILRSEALYLYLSDIPAPLGGSISRTAVADMEVISEDELVLSVAKLLPQTSKTVIPTVLVLSDELCFTQTVAEKSKEDDEKRLIGVTPFAHVATTTLTVQEQQYLIATNQDYYESVSRALALRGYQVTLVIPWSSLIHHRVTKGEVDMVTVKRVFDTMSDLRSSAFPLVVEKKESLSTVPSTKGKPQQKFLWGWIVFGVGASAYAFAMYWFFIRGA